ncbi:hypothetical protein [Streptomyces rubrogriseus]|uniref:hypothetical protein n=1 Tax=Streptomyces rubrogriseus TaxID=194673 RepID=UPI0037D32718
MAWNRSAEPLTELGKARARAASSVTEALGTGVVLDADRTHSRPQARETDLDLLALPVLAEVVRRTSADPRLADGDWSAVAEASRKPSRHERRR